MPWTPGALVSLQTERFSLKSIEREDADDRFGDWLADPEIMLGLNLPRRRLSHAERVSYAMNHDNAQRFCLIIRTLADSHAIGFYTVTVDGKNLIAETSVAVGDRDYWGQDVVRETRSALLDFLFLELGMHKVIGRPHSRNFSSIYNYKILGFKCEAVLREQMLSLRGDQRLDQLVFGMLRHEWLDRGGQTPDG